MDFVNHAAPTQPAVPRPMSSAESVELPKHRGKGNDWPTSRHDPLTTWSSVGTTVLLFIVALLVAAVVWLIYSSGSNSESKLVDNTKLQAVFLNTGQVYFGNVLALTKDYFVLTNIYYLQSNSGSSSSSSSQVSLVKLGCELHKPYNEMIINSSQVTFWENIQSDGQVAKAVAQFSQQNPSGQKCSNTPSSSSSSNLQSSNGTSSTTH